MNSKKLLIILTAAALFASACSQVLPQAGPSTSAIRQEALDRESPLTLIEFNGKILSAMKTLEKEKVSKNLALFSTERYSPRIDVGDVLEVVIYEQPPAVLFAQTGPMAIQSGVVAFQVPAQQVDDKGYIRIPFLGQVFAKGKRPEDLSEEIQSSLAKLANRPQVIVRVLDFRSSKVTVAGQVKDSRSIPLSYNVSTLLDVISAAGGITSPVGKTVIRVNRQGRTLEVPYEAVLKNPELNINLLPGDTITVVFKSQSATFLGATGKNEEMEFEAIGITLSQALGRVGGLRDDIAHAKGVFLFRLERPEVLQAMGIRPKAETREGLIPVVYNFDLSRAESFFLLREFELKDKDIVFVSTAPAVQLRKFLQTIADILTPIFQIRILTR